MAGGGSSAFLIRSLRGRSGHDRGRAGRAGRVMSEPTPGRAALDDLRFELKRGDFYEQHLASRIEDGLDAQTEAWLAYLAGRWRTDPPPEDGYYLGAWKRGGRWVVSELWFNTSTGWWASRGYLHDRAAGEAVRVVAWMPMPVYAPQVNPCGGLGSGP